MFPETFSDAYGLGKEFLLVIAEDLLSREIKFSTACAGEPSSQHHHVCLFGVGVLQHPPKLRERVDVTHSDQNSSRFDTHSFTFNRVLMQQLEMLAHRDLRVRELPGVGPFRDCEDDKEGSRKDDPCNRRYALSEEIYDGGGQQY